MASNSTEKIKRILLQGEFITKPELSKATGLTSATCGYILNSLFEKGEIVEEKFRTSNGGRPAKSYRYNAAKHQFLCLYALYENGIQTIRFRIFDTLGNILAKGETREKVIDRKSLCRVIRRNVERHSQVCVVAIGIQGGVSHGTVEFCDFPALDGINLAKELFDIFRMPILVENDMNAIALGYSQKNSEEKNVAILFVPKGNPPAGGFLVDGKILRGSANLAGELSRFPFSFNQREMPKMFTNLDIAFPHILQVLVATIVFLDPAIIVITGGFAEELSARNLDEKLRKNLRRPQLPRLAFKTNLQEEYFNGLYKMAKEIFIDRIDCSI